MTATAACIAESYRRAPGDDVHIGVAARQATVAAGTPVAAVRAAAAAAGLRYPHRPARPDTTVAEQLLLAHHSFSWLSVGSPLADVAEVELLGPDGTAITIARDGRLRSVRRALVGALARGARMSRLVLDLAPVPARQISVVATFDERVLGVRAAEAIIALCRPSSLDVIDEAALAGSAGHGEIPCYAPGAALFVQLTGDDPVRLRRDAALLDALCRRKGATSVRSQYDDDEVAGAVEALALNCAPALRAAGFRVVRSIVVPLSALAAFVADLTAVEQVAGVRMTLLIDGASTSLTVLAPPSATDCMVATAGQALDLLDYGQRNAT
jgi:glycolate oxidase